MSSILRSYYSEAFNHVNSLVKEVMKDGALSTKTKELMAIALSIATHCEPCVKIHTRRALQLGANEVEIAETIGVSVLLLGGPADVWPIQIIESEIERMKK